MDNLIGLANVSIASYDPVGVSIPDYVFIEDSVLVDPETGFNAHTYYHPESNSLVFAFGGTKELADIDDDIVLANGGVPEQATQALDYIDTQKTKFAEKGNSGFNVIFTGHSLGGFVAQYVHLTLGEGQAVVYNSPGIVSEDMKLLSGDIIYVYSNPLAWGVGEPVHGLGDNLGTSIFFVMGATGHGIIDLRAGMLGDDAEILTATEVKALAVEQFSDPSSHGGMFDLLLVWNTFFAINSDALGFDLRDALLEAGQGCFLAGTPVSIGNQQIVAIEEVKPGQLVMSYDKSGELGLSRVTQRFVKEVSHLLDVHGLKVTPGHVTLCGDGQFAGKHVPIIDILLSDGALVKEDASLIRMAINKPVGSLEDQFVKVSYALTAEDAQSGNLQSGEMRVGTLLFDKDGAPVSVLDCIRAEGMTFDPDTGLVCRVGQSPEPLYFYGPLPRPEDYILRRSRETLEGILAGEEWEGSPSELIVQRLRRTASARLN